MGAECHRPGTDNQTPKSHLFLHDRCLSALHTPQIAQRATSIRTLREFRRPGGRLSPQIPTPAGVFFSKIPYRQFLKIVKAAIRTPPGGGVLGNQSRCIPKPGAQRRVLIVRWKLRGAVLHADHKGTVALVSLYNRSHKWLCAAQVWDPTTKAGPTKLAS